MNTTWQRFEALTRRIQQDLAPSARVTHDEQLTGKSGAEHQCDVVLRAPVGQLEFMCVIECKDHNEPVGSEVMRSFIGKIADLRVHQGIMVAAQGFTKDARKLAREHDIKAYRLIDAASVRWRHEALLPIAFIRITLAQARVTFTDDHGNPRSYETNGTPARTEDLHVRHRQTRTYQALPKLLETLWDNLLDQRIPTAEDNVSTTEYEVYLGEQRHEKVTITAGFAPSITYHYNRISLATCQGFIDEENETLIPGSYETTPLSIDEIITKWPSTTKKSEVPFTPIDFFYLCGFFHRGARTPQHFSIGRTTGPLHNRATPLS